jgi:hypothetical protein
MRKADLPAKHLCRACGEEKVLDEMILIHRRSDWAWLLRSRCKDCNNKHERGHRRKWKTAYLRGWRFRNPEISEEYWRKRNEKDRAVINLRAYCRFRREHGAILIQGRMRRHGFRISLVEAKRLLKRFGRCYPSRFGLTPGGLREAERLRAGQRRSGKKMFSLFEIRMMVYEDGHFIRPSRQPVPYKRSSERLRSWQANRRQERLAA